MIDETGDPNRVIDHSHCSSIIGHSRLSSTILEYDTFFSERTNGVKSGRKNWYIVPVDSLCISSKYHTITKRSTVMIPDAPVY